MPLPTAISIPRWIVPVTLPVVWLAIATAWLPAQTGSTGEAEETVSLILADGGLQVATPADWEKVKPRNRIIEAELAIPPKDNSDGDDAKIAVGRLTIMAAGGGVRANLDRWVGQFRDTAEEPKIDESEVGGMRLTVLDIAGTYLDSPRGPFGPKVEKPGQRMLAAVLETGDLGNYFFKFVGPDALVEDQAEAFHEMLRGATKPEAN